MKLAFFESSEDKLAFFMRHASVHRDVPQMLQGVMKQNPQMHQWIKNLRRSGVELSFDGQSLGWKNSKSGEKYPLENPPVQIPRDMVEFLSGELDMIQEMIEADPTQNKAFVSWMYRQTKVPAPGGGFDLDWKNDKPVLVGEKGLLQWFLNNKARLPQDKRNLKVLSYHDLQHIWGEHAKFQDTVSLTSDIPGWDKVYENNFQFQTGEGTASTKWTVYKLTGGAKELSQLCEGAGRTSVCVRHVDTAQTYVAKRTFWTIYKDDLPFALVSSGAGDAEYGYKAEFKGFGYHHQTPKGDAIDNSELEITAYPGLVEAAIDSGIIGTWAQDGNATSLFNTNIGEPSEILEKKFLRSNDPATVLAYAEKAYGADNRGEYVPWPQGEALAIQTPLTASKYAIRVMNKRWPEAEETILQDTEASYEYAKNLIQGPWPEFEKKVLADPTMANPEFLAKYCEEVRRQRWPEVEHILLQDVEIATSYAKTHSVGHWPELASVLLQRAEEAEDPEDAAADLIGYYISAYEGDYQHWPEAEKYFLRDAYSVQAYTQRTKQRWPEGEAVIKNESEQLWNHYKTIMKSVGQEIPDET